MRRSEGSVGGDSILRICIALHWKIVGINLSCILPISEGVMSNLTDLYIRR